MAGFFIGLVLLKTMYTAIKAIILIAFILVVANYLRKAIRALKDKGDVSDGGSPIIEEADAPDASEGGSPIIEEID